MAAVDCGTNSTRLLVADGEGRTLVRLMRITRLGQGVDASGRLAPEAVERTVAVLGEYRAEMDRLGVVALRASATSAARDAANREDFFAPAEDVLGRRPELLSGDEEGRLSFAGATADLDPGRGPYVVLDIGGGSTEVVLGPPPGTRGLAPAGAVSVDVGCVRLTERHLHHDPPLPAEMEEASRAVGRAVDQVVEALPGLRGARELVGLAGTVTTLAAIHLGLARYDRERTHHSVLTRGQVDGLLAGLAGEDRAARLRRPGLEEARADVIVGGALVLAGVMSRLGLGACLVSESDILDGMVMTLLASGGGVPGSAAG
ncbi:MAG: exopolyphosphatase [Acidimicrobiales bacterium]